MAEKLGVGHCPLCGADNARVSLSKSHYAVLTCSGCNAQIFARGPKSDELLRDRIVVDKPVPAAVPPAPTIPDPVPDPEVPAPKPAPKKKSGSFLDMFAGGEA